MFSSNTIIKLLSGQFVGAVGASRKTSRIRLLIVLLLPPLCLGCAKENDDYEFVRSDFTRQASRSCGVFENAAGTYVGSSKYSEKNIGLSCGQLACRKPAENELEICIKNWAQKNGFQYIEPEICTFECNN